MQLTVRIEGESVCREVSLVPTREIKRNREAIKSLALTMMTMDCEKLDCPLNHHFSNGVYIREITMPAGSAIVGKIHKTEHFNIITSGECKVFTADEGWKHRKAGDIFSSKGGVQKALRCITDVTWLTVHIANEDDISKIEYDLSTEKYEDLECDQLLEERARIGI